MNEAERPAPVPRWPALVALLAVGVLNFVVPEQLSFGPGWVWLALIAAVAFPTMIFHQIGRHRLNEAFAYLGLVIITTTLVGSLALLLMRLPEHKDPPVELLRAAAALWVANILVFASWYWRLDGGGPNERDKRGVHVDGAFLFPQMLMDADLKERMGEAYWSPGFVDYLFLAFNTSTAFSPTDVPVLSRWAKVLMIIQSIISLTTVALLAARAVNIL
jgi:hypothetical protein